MKVLIPMLLMLSSVQLCVVLMECGMMNGMEISVLEDLHDGTSDSETYEFSEDESEMDADCVSDFSNTARRLSGVVQPTNTSVNPYFLEIPTPPPE